MQYLSAEWLRAADDAVRRIEVDPDVSVTIEQRVTEAPDGDIVYRLVVRDGRCRVVRISPDDLSATGADVADVTLTAPWPLAIAIAEGTESAQHAFLHGRLRVGGNPTELIRHAELAAEVAGVLASIA